MAIADLPAEGGSIFGRGARPDYTVNAATGCWDWAKSLTPSGYPHARAYRRYYEIAHGPVAEGMHVHHACGNKACVNPAHLEEIDPRDHYWHHKVDANTGLTLEDIRDIRELGRQRVSARKVAEDYGTTHTSIYNYWLARTWQDLLGDEPVQPADGVCRECSGPVRGNRNKQFCTTRCRATHNQRKGRERKRAAALRGTQPTNGGTR